MCERVTRQPHNSLQELSKQNLMFIFKIRLSNNPWSARANWFKFVYILRQNSRIESLRFQVLNFGEVYRSDVQNLMWKVDMKNSVSSKIVSLLGFCFLKRLKFSRNVYKENKNFLATKNHSRLWSTKDKQGNANTILYVYYKYLYEQSVFPRVY